MIRTALFALLTLLASLVARPALAHPHEPCDCADEGTDAPAEPKPHGKFHGVFDAGFAYERWWLAPSAGDVGNAPVVQLSGGFVHLTNDRFSLRATTELSLGYAADGCADDCLPSPTVPATLAFSGIARVHAGAFYAGVGARVGLLFWAAPRPLALGELVFGLSSPRRTGFHTELFAGGGLPGVSVGLRFGSVFPGRATL